MDTKSKNIKYSPWVKALCVLVSAAMFMLCSMNAIKVVLPLAAFGSDGVLNKNSKPDFYSMEAVQNIFKEKAYDAQSVASFDENDIKNYYGKIKQETINSAVKSYLNKRALAIKSELQNAVDNYRDDTLYFEYTKVSSEYVASIPDTPVEKQKYIVDFKLFQSLFLFYIKYIGKDTIKLI